MKERESGMRENVEQDRELENVESQVREKRMRESG